MNDSTNNMPPTDPGQGNNHSGWTPPTPNTSQPAGTKFFNSIRGSGFYRSEERWIGGVSGGLAQKYNVDPLIVRGAFILLTFLSGIGLIVYAAAWALLPEQKDGRIHAEELIRGNFDGAHIAIAIALLIGLSNSSRFFWGTAWIWGPIKGLFWLALVAVIIYGVLQFSGQDPKIKKDRSGPVWEQQPANYTHTSDGPTHQTWETPGTGTQSDAQPPVSETTGAMSQPTTQFPAAGPHGSATGPEYQKASHQWIDPEPMRPKVKSPGGVQFAILLGLFLLAAAGLLLADNLGNLSSSVALVPFLAGLAVTLGGLTVIFNGFRGHSSGSGGFFGVLGFLATGATSALLFTGVVSTSNANFISDSELTPTTVSQVTDGYVFGAGDFTLDLSELDLTAVAPGDRPIEIPISGAAGQISIVVPSDLAVTADQSVAVGSISNRAGTQDDSRGGIGVVNKSFANGPALEQDSADVHLDIRLAVGEVLITEKEVSK